MPRRAARATIPPSRRRRRPAVVRRSHDRTPPIVVRSMSIAVQLFDASIALASTPSSATVHRRRRGFGDSRDRHLQAIGTAVPVRHEVGSHFAAYLDAHERRQSRAEVEETDHGRRLAQRFIAVSIAMRARRSVEIGESAGTASVVANAQEQYAAARRHVLARLVAQFDVRGINSRATC